MHLGKYRILRCLSCEHPLRERASLAPSAMASRPLSRRPSANKRAVEKAIPLVAPSACSLPAGRIASQVQQQIVIRSTQDQFNTAFQSKHSLTDLSIALLLPPRKLWKIRRRHLRESADPGCHKKTPPAGRHFPEFALACQVQISWLRASITVCCCPNRSTHKGNLSKESERFSVFSRLPWLRFGRPPGSEECSGT